MIDAAESSLRLNTLLEWMEGQLERIQGGSAKYPRLRALALALAVFIPTTGVQTYDYYFGDDPPAVGLNEEDRKLFMELLELLRGNPAIESRRRSFFKTLERDPAINAVGVAEGPHARPAVLVPSSEFPERSGLWEPVTDELERTLYPILDVILIAPVLVQRPRSWTFQQEGLPEFSATMKDKRFLTALHDSHVREQLRTGIPMTIRLEVKEKKVDGDWVAKSRSVIEVVKPAVG